MPAHPARFGLGAGLLAGHREGHTDGGEELLAADLPSGLGLVLCNDLGLDGLVLVQRRRGDSRILVLRICLDRGSLGRLDRLGGGLSLGDALRCGALRAGVLGLG